MNIDQVVRESLLGKPVEPAVVFYDHPALDGKASEAKGRPVHRIETWVKVTPRDPELTVRDSRSLKATDKHKRQWPEAYARYQDTKETREGRPVGLLKSVSLADRADLAALGIFTIEQLVDVDPESISTLILERSHWEDAEAERRHEIKDAAIRAAVEFPTDFAEQISEARSYVETQGSASLGNPDRGVVHHDFGGKESEGVQVGQALPSFQASYSWTA